MIEDARGGAVPRAVGQRRLHAGTTGGVELFADVADKQDLPRSKLHVSGDPLVACPLALRSGGGVVVAAEMAGEVTVGRVAEEQPLRLD